MSLYDRGRHVPLPPTEWDPARAEDWLRRWSTAALERWARDGCWPVHPRDVEEGDPPGPHHSLYLGAGGVWLALVRLAHAGVCRLPAAPAELFAAVAAAYDRDPDTGARAPSWLLGEAGLRTALWLARRDDATGEQLAALVRSNRDNPTRELLWGAPGTMIAALFLYEATHDERWADLFRDGAAALESSWAHDPGTGAWLWEQELYGERTRYVGAGHGLAGNLAALWRGHALLGPGPRTRLRERTIASLTALARIDGDHANWPTLPGRSPMLVQWCHGAPGVITSLRHADLPELTPLLIQAADLVVAAGPLRKGVGLCHGTDGNGVALLELHRRTGDDRWLAHARRFAAAAILQSEATRDQHGEWRYTLWTGDAGLACFLLDCLRGRGRGLPGLDALW